VIIAGNRDDIRVMDKGIREVLDEILYLVDLHDLYGQIAYPKAAFGRNQIVFEQCL
jgi:sucrose-phosphate synthase